MVKITLPDGSQQQHASEITALKVAEQIGAGLARAALAAEVDGELVDLSYPIKKDSAVRLITSKDTEGVEILRHSCAHLLAHAVKRLFPTAQVTIGPVIENGFYYDFAFGRAFTPEDLAAIEKKMQELVKADIPVRRFCMDREEAIKFFQEIGEAYKVKIIEDIPAGDMLSFYQQDDFTDLCRGPHVPSTGKIKAFKLMKLSGAYWRGDSNNEMLQRIYGTAWADKDALKAYLHMLEEAEKRDHRKIAKQQDLFHMQQEAPGMIFWHDNGWTIYRIMMDYMREQLQARGYQEVHTPELVDRSLWERSGHWEKFGKEMFTTESENRDYAIKPMNCPCHIQIFNHSLKSYRDLPLRMAEFGSCHRNEPSGALHGLMRVRNLVQDDAHVFCTEDQIQSEADALVEFVFTVYKDFGFDSIDIKLSTRPDERVGADALWDKAEKALADMLDQRDLTWEENPGEGAFYGPKIEFTLYDCIGRAWQAGTIQLDFCMPERLGATYIAEDGSKQIPVMLHRAIFGSFERFMGIFIEECAGHFPAWLAPTQAVVMNITDAQAEYTQAVVAQLKAKGFRVTADLRNEKVGFKIREHTLQRVPYLLVVGDREVAEETVSVRSREGEDHGSMQIDQFVKKLAENVARLARHD